MPSEIVIEAEGFGESETILRLRIDSHLIAEHLTIAQAKFVVSEMLDRIVVFEPGNPVEEHNLRSLN